MSKLETFEIEYKGNKYLATEVENIFDPDSNDTIILASSRLNDVLVDQNGKFVDHEAEFVDERIFALYTYGHTRAGKSTALLLAAAAVGNSNIAFTFDGTTRGLAGRIAEKRFNPSRH